MGVHGPVLDSSQIAFIRKSPLFFVATAPLSSDGHINCSPRPVDSRFFVNSASEIGWLDLVGSGVETVAHLKENGRIVAMFCSFSEQPQVLRIHGTGQVFEPGHVRFEEITSGSPYEPGVRAVIIIRIERVSTSCGYGVPMMNFVSHRSTIDEWLELKGTKGLDAYKRKNNSSSIDGLDGLNLSE